MDRTEMPPQAALLQVIEGYWLSRVVWLAARLKLADIVGDRTASLADLARATGKNPVPLGRLLRALTANGIFREDASGAFSQTPMSTALRTGQPGSLRAFVELSLGHDHYEAWGQIESCLTEEGTAFERLYGMPVFAYYARHPELEAGFAEAMTDMSAVATKGIVGSYRFPSFTRAIDIGGGRGTLLAAMLKDHPDAEGILFDQPTVVGSLPGDDPDATAPGRLKLVGGDFFESVPPGGDLYIMKSVLHDWDDQRCVRILSNIRGAIALQGRLVVIEQILPAPNQPHLSPLMDLNMMVMTGGAERTEKEYGHLLERGGFHIDKVVATRSPFSVIEATPAAAESRTPGARLGP